MARIDRKLLAGLGDDEAYRTVRVPATGAKWSTRKRYCETAGISIGRAVTMLIDRELISVFGEHTAGEWQAFIFGVYSPDRRSVRNLRVGASSLDTLQIFIGPLPEADGVRRQFGIRVAEVHEPLLHGNVSTHIRHNVRFGTLLSGLDVVRGTARNRAIRRKEVQGESSGCV